jgi:hypothetical protein
MSDSYIPNLSALTNTPVFHVGEGIRDLPSELVVKMMLAVDSPWEICRIVSRYIQTSKDVFGDPEWNQVFQFLEIPVPRPGNRTHQSWLREWCTVLAPWNIQEAEAFLRLHAKRSDTAIFKWLLSRVQQWRDALLDEVFIVAASLGNLEMLNAVHDLGTRDFRVWDIAFLMAARRNYVNILQSTLAREQTPVARATFTRLLGEAVLFGAIDAVKFLLDEGAHLTSIMFTLAVEARENGVNDQTIVEMIVYMLGVFKSNPHTEQQLELTLGNAIFAAARSSTSEVFSILIQEFNSEKIMQVALHQVRERWNDLYDMTIARTILEQIHSIAMHENYALDVQAVIDSSGSESGDLESFLEELFTEFLE